MKFFFLSTAIVFCTSTVFGDELLTNCARFVNAPKWLSLNRVNKTAEPVENLMEWSTRRIEVTWYQDQLAFEKAHGMGPAALAVHLRGQNKVLLGPKVTEANFTQVFGHELVHVISAQKYQQAIPTWLEEGIANFISKNGQVNYKALSQLELNDVNDLSHPMQGSANMISVRYQASQALTEMIASKCEFRNLLRLSVGRKMQDYLKNICGISELNAEFKKWVKAKSGL
ncbi:MAG: hypothetical protein ACAH59_08055 [Pseudobdellovibrionaceae bacterium]